jgi:5-(carboxyamino)imidazole ribonucleotide synthase
MFAIAARRMGYRVHTLSPDDDTPTGHISDKEYTAEYEDLDAVSEFARGVSVVTFEFENVPAATAEAAARFSPVRPSGTVLHHTQHRLREKGFLANHSFPVAPYRAVRSTEELHDGVDVLGTPCILKTAGWGYDGKGQVSIQQPSEALAAWEKINRAEAVLEQRINFEREVSVIVARSIDGQLADYGVLDNTHVNSILDVTVSPAEVPSVVAKRAIEIAHGVAQAIDLVGVMCVEMFVTHNNDVLINELAPRPHNSGHLTFDACVTSQFEQQLRAICGLSLGSTELLRPAAMVNLLGDLWSSGEPNWAALCADPNVKLHLYGKQAARPGRKMGHITAFGGSVAVARQTALAAREVLLT